MTSSARRRAVLLSVAVGVVVLGLTVHGTVDGPGGAFTGDGLYAVLMFVLVAVVAPALPAAAVAGVAFALCVAVELFQLTGVPARLSSVIPGAELVLGSTFQWSDLVAYAIGAAFASGVDAAIRALLRRRAAGSSRGARTTPSAGAPRPRRRAGRPSR